MLLNDLGVMTAARGEVLQASELFSQAIRELQQYSSGSGEPSGGARGRGAANPGIILSHLHRQLKLVSSDSNGSIARASGMRPTRIAILSFLFNWPSTGGGIVHTVELAKFLARAGYQVEVFHPQYPDWEIGRVEADCPIPTRPLPFSRESWTIPGIQQRFREQVDTFQPDHVIITDCWNFKPHLAQAMEGYSYFLRMQALEGICPLNNLRLLPGEPGAFQQCCGSQLDAPQDCRMCLSQNEQISGGLHRAERALSQVGTFGYDQQLRRAARKATAVLVLNRSAHALWSPYAADCRIVTWGMDPERFPESRIPRTQADVGVTKILFAGLPHEPIKGFRILREACRQLWRERQDFELQVTADPQPDSEPFLRWLGWKSQTSLPDAYFHADFVVVPTVAQDGLSRTAVEGMAAGKAVLGSRLGGLPDVIAEHETWLLATSGEVADWVEKLGWLLDHPRERWEMGRRGREAFERNFTWEQVIQQHYAPLLGAAERAAAEVN